MFILNDCITHHQKPEHQLNAHEVIRDLNGIFSRQIKTPCNNLANNAYHLKNSMGINTELI